MYFWKQECSHIYEKSFLSKTQVQNGIRDRDSIWFYKLTKSEFLIFCPLHSYQMLYADTYMTKEEFREMFDHRLYDESRVKYDCLKAFPDVYDKISRSART